MKGIIVQLVFSLCTSGIHLVCEKDLLFRTISVDWSGTRDALDGTPELEVIAFLLIQIKVQ